MKIISVYRMLIGISFASDIPKNQYPIKLFIHNKTGPVYERIRTNTGLYRRYNG